MPSKTYLGELRQILMDYFNETDLRNFCQDLGIDYEDLSGGTGIADKSREMVYFCDRRGILPELVNAINRERSGIPSDSLIKAAADDPHAFERQKAIADGLKAEGNLRHAIDAYLLAGRIALGREAFDNQETAEAFLCFLEAQALAEKAGYTDDKRECYLTLATLYFKAHLYPEAKARAEQLLHAAKPSLQRAEARLIYANTFWSWKGSAAIRSLQAPWNRRCAGPEVTRLTSDILCALRAFRCAGQEYKDQAMAFTMAFRREARRGGMDIELMFSNLYQAEDCCLKAKKAWAMVENIVQHLQRLIGDEIENKGNRKQGIRQIVTEAREHQERILKDVDEVRASITYLADTRDQDYP